ncbi:MAG TPA: HD domain-containing phosphohydrolase [Candidatus Avalokitesvara rifleensis]|uniref:HD domain-containing phosphohydrolase n=1 Tax=Candidatus Avalokitesvara rifleensis TaxID=3367620 RepID=UPI002712948F|nr:PAS domain S-box protein [Candidatus Brocadiales bacterium]
MKPLYSLRARLLIFGLCISLIPIAIITTIYYLNARNTLKKQTMNWMKAVAESRKMHLLEFLEGEKRTVAALSAGIDIDKNFIHALEKVKRGEPVDSDIFTASSEHLRKEVEKFPHILRIAIMGMNGKVVASCHETIIGQDMSDKEVFISGGRGPHVEPYKSSPYFEGVGCICTSTPIFSMESGETVGVIVTVHNLAILNKVTTGRAGLGKTGEVYIVDKDKIMLTESRFIEGAPSEQMVDTEPVRKILESSEEMVGIYPDYRGIPVVGASAYLPEYGWTLLAEIDKSEAFAPLRALGVVALIIGLVAAAAVTGVGIVFAFSTSRPIRRLTDATRRFADGDLDYRVKIARKDEIGELADSFNVMAGEIVEKTRESVRARELVKEITAREYAEESLLESEEKFRNISVSAQDAIIMANNEGKISFWNDAAKKIFGWSREEVVGKLIHRLIAPEKFREDAMRGFERFKDTGQGPIIGKMVEFSAINKDGTEFPIELSLSAVKIKDKWTAIGIVRDITERKRAEEKLKVLRELDKNIIAHTADYNEIFETATHLVNKIIPCDRVTMVLVDEERGGFIYCHGWGTAARKKGDFVPFEMTDASRAVREKRTILRNDLRQEGELKSLDKQFLEEGFLSDIRVPFIVKGKVAGLLNIGSRRADAFTKDDVATAETIANQLSVALENSLLFKNLEESKRHVTHILGSITDAFFALDREWRFTYVNPEAERHLQKKQEELIGRSIWDEFPEAVNTTFYREYRKAMSEQVGVVVEEFYPPFNRWYEARAYPSKEGLSVYFRDVTERRHAEEERKQSLEKLRKALGGTIQVLVAAVEIRDPYTAGHQQGVAHLARAIASEMGLSLGQIEGIRMAGAIHDIGKIAVPAEILSKPGKITKTEFDIIKTHPQVGYDILKGIEFPWPIARIVLQHQERLDGSGYPAGLKGDEIILEARILTVADVVEAMASHRPYRPALGIDKALEEISENRGILYDADVVDACVRLFREKGFKFG